MRGKGNRGKEENGREVKQWEREARTDGSREWKGMGGMRENGRMGWY